MVDAAGAAGDCGRHSDEEKAFIDAELDAYREMMVGEETEFRCMDCGAQVWADSLALWDDYAGTVPEHCGWEMIRLPNSRAATG